MDGFNFLRLLTLPLLALCNGMGSSKFLHYELVSDCFSSFLCVRKKGCQIEVNISVFIIRKSDKELT